MAGMAEGPRHRATQARAAEGESGSYTQKQSQPRESFNTLGERERLGLLLAHPPSEEESRFQGKAETSAAAGERGKPAADPAGGTHSPLPAKAVAV